MRVLLLQLDGSLPNLALMRLAAHHRGIGDDVELRHAPTLASVERRLGDDFDRVYASLIFERTRPVAERLLRVWPRAVVGGTGWDLTTTLESGAGIPTEGPLDYSDYPAFRHSVGFTQRGCRLSCEFCVVPRKEGKARGVATARDVWRGEPWPRHLILLDNDFFGQPAWRERVAEFREGKFRVNFNQGINARMLSQEASEAIAALDYYDADFKKRRLYTAWDNLGDEEVLFRGLARLKAAGVPPGRVMVYILVGYWAGETEESWLYRVRRLREFGADPYPMPYVRNSLTVGFQRWVCGHYDRRIPWVDWRAANCDPRRLGASRGDGRVALPLLAPALEGEEAP